MSIPILIDESNLSIAWLKIFQSIIDHPGKEIMPLVLTLSNFDEIDEIKNTLNIDLKTHGLDSVEVVSETIFPQSLYEYYKKDKKVLFDKYLTQILPRIKRIDSRNSNGTYFERLIAFGDKNNNKNQLDIIIDSLNGTNKRRSKLQAAIFDPLKDHKNSVFQGFPCLQHVTFYKSESGGLVLNSFYAVQYLYQRAYGNWLGLINLGKFIAEETNLKFERFNCFIGVEQLDHLNKIEAKKLVTKMNIKPND